MHKNHTDPMTNFRIPFPDETIMEYIGILNRCHPQ
jgi:hypothetical protein